MDFNILANTMCINTIKGTVPALQHNDFIYLKIMSLTIYLGPYIVVLKEN